MGGLQGRGLRRVWGVALLMLNGALALLYLLAPTVTERLDPAEIKPESGFNYTVAMPYRVPFPYRVDADSPAGPEGSNSILLEDGKPIEPGHAQHAEIRSRGAGRHSFWSGDLYFSASDNTDPRSNGRRYEVVYFASPPLWGAAGIAIIDALSLILFRSAVIAFAARHGRLILALIVAGVAMRAAAAALGLAPPIFVASAGRLDMALVLSLLFHLGLGLALSGLLFATGAGVVRAVGPRDMALEDLLLRAFLPGIVVIAIAAILALAVPFGGIAALLVILLAAAPLRGYRPERATARRAFSIVATVLPAACMLASLFAFQWHGPTATLAATTLGDPAVFLGRANTLTQQLLPFWNFGAEGGRFGFGNVLPALLMAPLVRFDWFDPDLFMTSSLVLMTVLSLALELAMLDMARRRAGIGAGPVPAFAAIMVAALLAAALRHPSALVASPPFAFALPLLVSVAYFWRVGAPRHANALEGMAMAVLSSAATKVVMVLVTGPLLLPDIARTVLRQASRRMLIAVALLALAFGLYAIALLVIYLPEFLEIGHFGPASWDIVAHYHVTAAIPVACYVARDAGALLLAVTVSRLGLPGLALGAWAGMLAFLLAPYLFYPTPTAVLFVTGLLFFIEPHRLAPVRGMMAASVLLMLPLTFYTELGGTLLWLVHAAVMAFAVAAALGSASTEGQGARRPLRQVSRRVAWAVAALLAVVLPAVGAGAIHAGPTTALVFTPELRDIWLAVRSHTPRGALIFTDQTDDTESRIGGWNDYALTAQRQFYLVSWSDHALRFDPVRRARTLETNGAILDGTQRPGALSLSRSYNGFYAVLSVKHAAPPAATLLYENAGYRLYQLQP